MASKKIASRTKKRATRSTTGLKTMRFTLPKGLTRQEAAKELWKRAKRAGKTDARGISYDPKTGKGSIT